MTAEELSRSVIELAGGLENIISAINCMTRLRIRVREDELIRDDELKGLEGILAVMHSQQSYVEVVVGPKLSQSCIEVFRSLGIGASTPAPAQQDEKPSQLGKKDAEGWGMHLAKSLGQVFAPLIPGIIAAGLCAGLSSLLKQMVPSYADVPALAVIYHLFSGTSAAFMTYITAWAGYRAAELFGGTPILGGMVGMFTTLSNVNDISAALGLYNDAQPLDAILRSGRGGVLAAIIGVWIMCKIERIIRSRLPNALDVVFTPLLTLLATLIPYVLIVMPALGLVSTLICDLVEFVAINPNPLIRMVAGYIGAALFLPMVAMGMHHGLIAIYAVQLEAFGYVTFYPALAMAGAGQIGAALALVRKAKASGNDSLVKAINGALPAGLMGIGEPLIYGVMLPLGKPFFTAGLGAGFGGAFVMLMQVASTTWGPSGLLGVFVMTEGPGGAVVSMTCYLAGFAISCIAGYLITAFALKDADVAE